MKFLRGHITLVPLFFLLVIPLKVQGSDLTCPVQEMPVNGLYQWRVTDTSCPEGTGLWSKTPAINQGVFWVQCAYTRKIPDVWFRELLAKIAPADKVVLRKELGRFRCLLGPYHSYSEAVMIRNQMHSHQDLKQAFVRSVSNQEMAAYKPVPMPPPQEVVPEQQDYVAMPESVVETQTDTSMKSKSVWNRDFYQVGDIYSPVPTEEEPHYLEGEKKWLRASFEQATEICIGNGMSIVTSNKLKSTAENNATNASLPKRLPYWVQDKVAFDIVMMVPIALTENSAIFVFCE